MHRPTIDHNRRRLLRGLLAAPGVSLFTALPGLTLAASPANDDKRFILVILRGAMDGLAAVAPYGDPALANLRGALLVPSEQLLKLDSFFGLHPAFTNLHDMYEQKELLVCHAVASPYRERSHFDGQNVLESGLGKPDESASGWLNRCIPLLGDQEAGAAIAIGQSIPEVLLGDNAAASWSPPRFPALNEGTLDRLLQLYGNDTFLEERLTQALQTNAKAGAKPAETEAAKQEFDALIDATANFLKQDKGPTMAVLEHSSGWDTHANQGGSEGALPNRFKQLDASLARLKQKLGERWQHTVVAVATEFGRTAAVNGTKGTDHGTAGVALLLGGAVKGGRIQGEWPGLAPGMLYQERDLAPTTDLRALFKTVLRDHLGVEMERIEQEVFPGSGKAGYVKGIV